MTLLSRQGQRGGVVPYVSVGPCELWCGERILMWLGVRVSVGFVNILWGHILWGTVREREIWNSTEILHGLSFNQCSLSCNVALFSDTRNIQFSTFGTYKIQERAVCILVP